MDAADPAAVAAAAAGPVAAPAVPAPAAAAPAVAVAVAAPWPAPVSSTMRSPTESRSCSSRNSSNEPPTSLRHHRINKQHFVFTELTAATGMPPPPLPSPQLLPPLSPPPPRLPPPRLPQQSLSLPPGPPL